MDQIQTLIGTAQKTINTVQQVISNAQQVVSKDQETQQVVSKDQETQQVVSKGQANKYFWDGIMIGFTLAGLLFTMTSPTRKLTHEEETLKQKTEKLHN